MSEAIQRDGLTYFVVLFGKFKWALYLHFFSALSCSIAIDEHADGSVSTGKFTISHFCELSHKISAGVAIESWCNVSMVYIALQNHIADVEQICMVLHDSNDIELDYQHSQIVFNAR